jgi:hypothetical protein
LRILANGMGGKCAWANLSTVVRSQAAW